MGNCYYSLIRRGANGRILAWVPDLPGISAAGEQEEQVIRELSRNARTCLEQIAAKALPVPPPRPVEELPCGDGQGLYRRLLLIL